LSELMVMESLKKNWSAKGEDFAEVNYG